MNESMEEEEEGRKEGREGGWKPLFVLVVDFYGISIDTPIMAGFELSM